MVSFAEEKGVRRRPVYINISKDIIIKQAAAYIMRNIQGEVAFYKPYMRDSKTLNQDFDILKTGETSPSPCNYRNH